jgi:hypothetical protein
LVADYLAVDYSTAPCRADPRQLRRPQRDASASPREGYPLGGDHEREFARQEVRLEMLYVAPAEHYELLVALLE